VRPRTRQRSLALVLVALAAVACSDGGSPIQDPIKPLPTTGTISGAVSSNSVMLAGVGLTLSNGRTATTGTNGGFSFADVEAGAYTLSIAVPAGYELAGGEASSKAVTVTAGNASRVDFSVVKEFDVSEAVRLFDHETFGGNGRTCVTCHMPATGTITLQAVAARLAASPNDPLFRHDAMDNGTSGTSRITAHGTIRVELDLPPNISLAGNPDRRQIIVNRGVPSTMNSPALDGKGALGALMLDLRHSNLREQALGAIEGHALSTVEPTFDQLALIAEFQQRDPRFFSSEALRSFANSGGSAPSLPTALNESESRGAVFFQNVFPNGRAGECALCHSGPGLNEVNQFGPQTVGLPQGAKFGNVGVAERNANGNPTFTFRVDNGAGVIRTVTLADPGIMLTGRSVEHVAAFVTANRHPADLAGFFKTVSLWGVRNTAPYFHDNSAKTLRDVVDHYADFFFPTIGVFLTPQDRIDIVAFLERL
jgi:cytochrome c peroxidase